MSPRALSRTWAAHKAVQLTAAADEADARGLREGAFLRHTAWLWWTKVWIRPEGVA